MSIKCRVRWIAERDVGMEVLDLGNNSMSESSAASLAAYLEKHRDLRDLNLYMNAIGSDGLQKVNSLLLNLRVSAVWKYSA